MGKCEKCAHTDLALLLDLAPEVLHLGRDVVALAGSLAELVLEVVDLGDLGRVALAVSLLLGPDLGHLLHDGSEMSWRDTELQLALRKRSRGNWEGGGGGDL